MWDCAHVKIVDIRYHEVQGTELINTGQQSASSFFYVVHGAARIQLHERVYVASPGFVIHSSISAGEEIHISAREALCKMYWISYDAQLPDGHSIPCAVEDEGQCSPFEMQFGFLSKPSVAFNERIRQLHKCWQRADDRERLYCKAIFYHVVDEILGQLYDGSEDNDVKEDAVSRVVQYIHEYYDKPIPLQLLADHVSYSVAHLSALFKERTNLSPIDYLIQVRMQQAEVLLLGTNASLREISASVGYKDAGYFSRLFKRSHGMTPLQFKKNGGRNANIRR
ncbi:AraC family transcriptional regulator [Paenibacillaceae bacterium]|nr:AraC family transcriptional regulator [Paenibacillaceae bacterium]